jgi:hypothetical protein
VSALAHYLEEEGIATVAISLIRAQTEKTRPPRALWVPFELGRPLGPPNEHEFQKRVILAALQLLEREHGPVIIEDFPDDDPRAQPDPSWGPPIEPTGAAGRSSGALAARLEAEIPLLRDTHAQWQAQRGHTTVGLCALPIAQCGRYVADWLRGCAPPSMRDGFSAPLMLRFALDDLKAYYLEAGAVGASKPSSQQLGERDRCRCCDLGAARGLPHKRGRAPQIDCRQFHGTCGACAEPRVSRYAGDGRDQGLGLRHRRHRSRLA